MNLRHQVILDIEPALDIRKDLPVKARTRHGWEDSLAAPARNCGNDLGDCQVRDHEITTPLNGCVERIAAGLGQVEFNQRAGIQIQWASPILIGGDISIRDGLHDPR